ncbi:MAG: asparagine--tRNA ligase [Pirellulaceae bacterium]
MADFPWFSVSQARQEQAIGKQVEVRGWVRSRRDSKGGFSFLEINDGSCLGNIQAIADQSLPNYESEILQLSVGSSIKVAGEVVASQGGKQATELKASSVVVTGHADPQEYPLQKKRHTLEKLREWAHLRPRTNTISAVARVRNRISFSTHQFFQENGFFYIHTPIITASDCEGAGQMFRVTTLPMDKLPMADGRVDYSQDFFGRSAFLTVSGQLEGEIYATALSKIYTFGPTFRAENSNTSRHLAEFWMIEPEMAFYELSDNMQLAEAYLKRMVRDVLNDCGEDMAFFDQWVENGLLQRLQAVLDKEFVRLSYTEAIDILSRSSQKFDYPVAWGSDLQAEHERFLTEQHIQGPIILYDYPAAIKSFYMRRNEDGKTVRAMDVLVPGVGEIIGGSQREERLEVLQQRMQEMGLSEKDYWWYLELRKYGTVPHSGFGLGLERAVQFITGMMNIRDVIPFPRYPGSAEF